MTTQELQFGVATQSLVFDCPDGRPTAITSVKVYEADNDDTGTALVATTGSAAIESNPNTTIDLASGASEANPRKVYVAATTGAAVGRRYIVADATGHYEWFETSDIASADYLIAKHPLLNDYAVGATVKSARCSIAVLATWAANITYCSPALTPNPRYRARWEVVVSGATEVYFRGFDLVRYPARHSVTPLDVSRQHSNWIDWLPPDERVDQGRGLIARAWNAVKFDLYGDNKADQAIRNAEALDEVVIARCVQMTLIDRAKAGGDVTAFQIEIADRDYRQRYDQLIRAPVIAVDTTGGGAASTNRPANIFSR